jgi:hypothetical protein
MRPEIKRSIVILIMAILFGFLLHAVGYAIYSQGYHDGETYANSIWSQSAMNRIDSIPRTDVGTSYFTDGEWANYSIAYYNLSYPNSSSIYSKYTYCRENETAQDSDDFVLHVICDGGSTS